MIRFPVLSAIRHYAAKARMLRNAARVERALNALPPDIRADIGWPDRRTEFSPRK